ncbi:hypothetical protein AAFP35_07850 [Gordonia sp. CPCC 206044]|uniref:hypothetical protein n=1 Tax=Gordonia sp. CPCC 206044 TaxID=3140793 RepID=UPI003AF3D586
MTRRLRLIYMDDFRDLDHAVNRQELLAGGRTEYDIRLAVDAGVLEYLSRGVLIPAAVLDGTPEQRHRELCTAWMRRAPHAKRALAEVSAAAQLGLPVWGLDVERVVMADWSRTPGSRSTGGMRLVTDRRPVATVVANGLSVTSPARTVVDIARRSGRIPAIAVGDAALHAELCTADDLQNELDLIEGMTGAARARRAVAEMSGLAESVLESRSRIEMLDAGIPRPALQVDIYDDAGRWVARVDFYWETERVVGECDGASKYNGSEGPALMLYEKRRTDTLVELGNRVIHWGWGDVDAASQLIARVRRVLTPPAA